MSCIGAAVGAGEPAQQSVPAAPARGGCTICGPGKDLYVKINDKPHGVEQTYQGLKSLFIIFHSKRDVWVAGTDSGGASKICRNAKGGTSKNSWNG
ncbi:MAG: hypothetical protein FRX49_06044 [Trebouxia sp. A1-2]|nr:MAG: hypothetical protein FRX49_06044 [Trebouxia sp. A1-2]